MIGGRHYRDLLMMMVSIPMISIHQMQGHGPDHVHTYSM